MFSQVIFGGLYEDYGTGVGVCFWSNHVTSDDLKKLRRTWQPTTSGSLVLKTGQHVRLGIPALSQAHHLGGREPGGWLKGQVTCAVLRGGCCYLFSWGLFFSAGSYQKRKGTSSPLSLHRQVSTSFVFKDCTLDLLLHLSKVANWKGVVTGDLLQKLWQNLGGDDEHHGKWGGKPELYYLEDHPRTCKWLITMVSKSH